MVGPGTRQRRDGEPVAAGQAAHVFPDFLLRERRRQLEEPPEAEGFRDVGEERLEGLDSDGPQHLLLIVRGMRDVVHKTFLS